MVRVDTKFLFKKKHFAPLSPKLGGGAAAAAGVSGLNQKNINDKYCLFSVQVACFTAVPSVTPTIGTA